MGALEYKLFSQNSGINNNLVIKTILKISKINNNITRSDFTIFSKLIKSSELLTETFSTIYSYKNKEIEYLKNFHSTLQINKTAHTASLFEVTQKAIEEAKKSNEKLLNDNSLLNEQNRQVIDDMFSKQIEKFNEQASYKPMSEDNALKYREMNFDHLKEYREKLDQYNSVDTLLDKLYDLQKELPLKKLISSTELLLNSYEHYLALMDVKGNVLNKLVSILDEI